MSRSNDAASLDILAVIRPHVRALKKESSCWRSFCPFHEEKTPSFTIWPETGRWKCYGCGQWGRNAIDFEVFRLKCSRESAIESLLGMPIADHNKPVARPVAQKPMQYPEINWKGYVSKISDQWILDLCDWRGYDEDFVRWLVGMELIGNRQGCVAFPIKDAKSRIVRAHIRRRSGKRWFYDPIKGHESTPLIIGRNHENAVIAESQWDLLALMNHAFYAGGMDKCWIATRGSSNASKLANLRFSQSTIFPQNDEPGRKWAREVAAILTPSRIIVTPAPYKDVNDLWKSEHSLAKLKS